jgi:hypothetical protein
MDAIAIHIKGCLYYGKDPPAILKVRRSVRTTGVRSKLDSPSGRPNGRAGRDRPLMQHEAAIPDAPAMPLALGYSARNATTGSA